MVETSESASKKAVTSSAKKRKLDESWIVSTDKNSEPAVSAKPLTLTFKKTSEPEEKEVEEEEEEEIVGRKRTNKRTAVIVDSDSEDDDILPDR